MGKNQLETTPLKALQSWTDSAVLNSLMNETKLDPPYNTINVSRKPPKGSLSWERLSRKIPRPAKLESEPSPRKFNISLQGAGNPAPPVACPKSSVCGNH